MKRKISVIVPVYNVEKYLKKCVNSILNQTYTDIEIILIDDGSTDSSGVICDEYSKEYDRIKTFHKKNGGLMSAWKNGVNYATGEYIGFIDSDDWIDENMYEKLLEAIQIENADISVCGLVKGEYIYTQPSVFKGAMDVESVYPKLVNTGEFMGRGVIPSRVVKLFKRNIVEYTLPYCIDDITLGEDMTMSFAAFMFAKKVVFLNDFFPYHYRVNLESITQKFNDNIFQKVLIFERQLMLVQDNQKAYDFTSQIKADFISNVINIIERVCHSDLSYLEKKKYISMVENHSEVTNVLEDIKCNAWSIRYKIYYFLLKKKCINVILQYGSLIYIFRKIKTIFYKKRIRETSV